MEMTKPECAKCGIKNKICQSPEGQGPAFCPTLHRKESIEKANEEYTKPDIRKFANKASVQEGECYINRGVKPYVLHPTKPRVQEVCEFAQKMGYKKLGIAFSDLKASVQEGECYINRGVKPYVLHPTKPRVQEVCEFAQKMGYKKLGIAF